MDDPQSGSPVNMKDVARRLGLTQGTPSHAPTPLVNQLQSNIVRGMRKNYLSVPSIAPSGTSAWAGWVMRGF